MKTIHIRKKRYELDIVNDQFFIIPTLGFANRSTGYTFAVGFVWLNIIFCVKFRLFRRMNKE